MSANAPSLAAEALAADLDWLSAVVSARMERSVSGSGPALAELPPPPLSPDTPWGQRMGGDGRDVANRLLVLLALAPHVRPEALDVLFSVNALLGRRYTEVGGLEGAQHLGFLPTGETALFLLAEGDLAARAALLARLDPGGALAQQDLVHLDAAPPGEPAASGALRVSDALVGHVTRGVERTAGGGPAAPARPLASALAWEDLVLPPATMDPLARVVAWLTSDLASSSLGRHLRPGYRCLFHGPPGTGKTLTATLLGQRVGMAVHGVALSAVAGQEAGGAFARVAARAEAAGALLFVDASDAPEGIAGPAVASLLPHLEAFAGLVVLATSGREALSDTALRRFQSVVAFPMPDRDARERLWGQALAPSADGVPLAEDVDLAELAARYELSGSGIVAAALQATLAARARGERTLRQSDLLSGVRDVFQRTGKTL